MITEFKFWVPEGVDKVSKILVITPPSGSDGRDDVNDPFWQAFATKHKMGLVGCYFADDQPSWIEKYCDMNNFAGEALIDFIAAQEEVSKEKDAKLFLWGFSAGGQFNYEFTAHYPEYVGAFVVNKGGVYFTALADAEARAVPGLWITGLNDSAWRKNIVNGIVSLNNVAGAGWTIVQEMTGHSIGNSMHLGVKFFEDVLAAGE